ncbi:ATPase assembly factor ATP10, mitochondria [Corchorus olitorius]|uniref:ATPase assembly factor ATP10, mitochondria n=1 Tax=Corchorus olitorius TaxID=93759 RepID=A0A1R3J6B1_9ROSI|nr:ATPase assembly factor ATP10, mitochondria [Corchorus olitorius]
MEFYFLIRHSFLHFSLLISLISISFAYGTEFKIPRLGALRRKVGSEPETTSTSSSVSNDFETFFYNQTLDHFNYRPESYTTFPQRYVVNSKYWGGSKTSSPILVYFGAEESLDFDLAGIGFLTDNAPRFKALLLYIEHRFYGKSIPFGSREVALRNASIRGYFTSAQAIADYAAIILHVKKTFSAKNSPVIVIGGSYGGMLAAWFRLKYPHVALGALASSAPILYFDEIAPQIGYYAIVTKDFKETSESCYETIRKSWDEIEKVASKSNGLSILSKKFKTCQKLKRTFDLKDYLDSIYSEAAQYDHPPWYPLNIVCGGIDGAPKGTDILGRIFAGVVAYMGNKSCYDMDEYNHPTETFMGWRWQTCSEIVMPIGHGNNDTMFPPAPFNLNRFIKKCKSLFGVQPQPHWVTTYYGGHDLKLILHRFASNIIFSNGLRDPYSSGGVLENISDSVVAVYTVNGSHCLDILPERKSDPQWLVKQRKTEVQIIESWIAKYYTDLIATANKILIPAVAAVKFPGLEVTHSDGKTLKLPITINGNEVDADKLAVPKASLVCLSFRASSQAMIDSWSKPFYEAHRESNQVQLYEVSFVDSWLLCLNPIKRLLLRTMRKSSHGEDTLQRQIVYSFGDHYYFRKELKILNLLTGYVFLLDKFGRVRWQGFGLATQEELSSLLSCTTLLLEEK